MYVQLLPLLLHLDQAALAFLQHIFAPDEGGTTSSGSSNNAGFEKACADAQVPSGLQKLWPACACENSSLVHLLQNRACLMLMLTSPSLCLLRSCCTGPELFFQRCEVQPFTLTINYRPHRIDLAALSRCGWFGWVEGNYTWERSCLWSA